MTIDCQGTNLPRSILSSMDISWGNASWSYKICSSGTPHPLPAVPRDKKKECWKWLLRNSIIPWQISGNRWRCRKLSLWNWKKENDISIDPQQLIVSSFSCFWHGTFLFLLLSAMPKEKKKDETYRNNDSYFLTQAHEDTTYEWPLQRL